jgi:hypothetical protein
MKTTKISQEEKDRQSKYPCPQYWKEYKRLGGSHKKQDFFKHLDKFIEFTIDAYVHGEGEKSREESFDDWAHYLNDDYEEAGIYFHAVDNITAYS